MFDFSYLMSSMVLIAMGCVSTGIFLLLNRKTREVENLPKNLESKVFDKRFNVFDPFPDGRKIIQSSVLTMLPALILFGAIILTFVVTAKIIEVGFLLGAVTFVVCAALMTFEEAFEVPSNATTIVKAVRNGTDLGDGDLTVLSIVKETLPKLKNYYLILAVTFFASSVILPYILPSVIFVFARVVTAPMELTPSQGILAAYYTLLLIAVGTFTLQVTAGKIKQKIFGFPQPESLYSMSKPFELMKLWVHWCMEELAHRKVPEPDRRPDSERRRP
jgi:hypothetical protein